MLTLNACLCPQCHYYLGYSTTQPGFNDRRTIVMGSCLNCDYRLPIHAVLRGRRTLPGLARRSASGLKLILGKSAHFSPSAPALRHRRSAHEPSSASSPYYGRDLRAVGQALENLQLKNFNLKRAGRTYFIWDRDPTQASNSARRSKGPLKIRTPSFAPSYRLDRDDVERIERESVGRRQKTYGVADGRRLSHLLRTLGEQINSRGQHFLGVSWREQSVSVVIETAAGRRQIDEFPTDHLYDIWVRKYLRRAH